MSQFLALDPGSTHTGYVVFDRDAGVPVKFGKIDNAEILREIARGDTWIVCEFPYPRGQAIQWQTLETCWWAGKFAREAEYAGRLFERVDRADVKRFVTGKGGNVKDKQVRLALIERFGGEESLAGGKCKACKGRGATGRGKAAKPCDRCDGKGTIEPGILRGFSADAWAALAVAVYYANNGASKSAAEKQEDRKARKANEKVLAAEKIITLEQTKQQVWATDCRTPKQEDAKAKRLSGIERQIEQLRKKINGKGKTNGPGGPGALGSQTGP